MRNDSYVNAVARQSGSNFYFSFFSLPREKREAITAVYAFCREADDAVDAPSAGDPPMTPAPRDAETPEGAIARWREEINRTYDGQPTLPLTRSLLEAIERFQLSKVYFDGILEGVAMDLRTTRYPTWEALSKYCYHVAGEVGLLCMEIFGYRSERLKNYAVRLGTAFQVTNILRDIKTDAARGRIYLPQEDLKRFGVEEEWIFEKSRRPSLTPACRQAGPLLSLRGRGSMPIPLPSRERLGEGWLPFQKLMAFEARRARGYYREALVLPISEERPALRAAEIMRAIYENLLDRIERSGYNVFERRIQVPTPVKIALALKTWWDCRA